MYKAAVFVFLQKWLNGGAMDERVRSTGQFQLGKLTLILSWVVMVASHPAFSEDGETGKLAANPHGDPVQCHVCHIPSEEGLGPLQFGGNISQLCESCHDGRRATREVHPVDMVPTEAVRQSIPSRLPLDESKVSCQTCHDVSWACRPPSSDSSLPANSLRGGPLANPMMFCFQCHRQDSYSAFNAHDQLDVNEVKTDTCLWCHTDVPDVSLRWAAGALQTLRRQASGVCRSCHRVAQNHPSGDSHMDAVPTAEMRWHMSAYEMQSTMRLSFSQLLKYARTTQRAPRSMPLDERGRIACFTCHNPHEKGLLPTRNPRSVGAEPKRAVNHRLRVHQGNMCVACHEK